MSTEKTNPTPTQGISLEEAAKSYLIKLHVASFDKFLQAKFPQGIAEVPKEKLDELFEAFSCGFNAGIFQAAGETLMLVGVNLNSLAPFEARETKASDTNPKKEEEAAE